MRPQRRIARPKRDCRGAARECRSHRGVDITGAATQPLGSLIATRGMCLSELGSALPLGRQSERSQLPKTASRLGTRSASEDRCSLSSARPSAQVTGPATPSSTGEELIRYGLRMTRRVVSGHPQFRSHAPYCRLQGRESCQTSHERPKQRLQRHQNCRPSWRSVPYKRHLLRRRSNGKISRGSSNHGEPVRRGISGNVLSLNITL